MSAAGASIVVLAVAFATVCVHQSSADSRGRSRWQQFGIESPDSVGSRTRPPGSSIWSGSARAFAAAARLSGSAIHS